MPTIVSPASSLFCKKPAATITTGCAPRGRNALFAVFLAGAVALSVQAVHQGSFLRVPASATFAEPGAFAAWLALFVPGVCAAVAVCRFDRVPRWIGVVCALLIMPAVGAFTAAALSAYRLADATTPPLLETWRDTGKMIVAHPWLGV